MSHSFDTGLSIPQRTAIRQGAVSLLSAMKLPAGYLVNVIPWGSVVRTHTDEQGIAELVDVLARTPSIAIALGDGQFFPAGIGGHQAKKTIDLLVYHASGNQRGRTGGRTEMDVSALASDHADPGLDVMMEHALELLIGQRCGASSSIKQIIPDREEELYTSAPITLWLQTYRVEVRMNVPETSTRAREFRTAAQILTSMRSRVATDPAEVVPPAAATDPGSVDANTDDLGA